MNKPTEYVVLYSDKEGDDEATPVWQEYGRAEAHSADAAVRNAITEGAKSGAYVAVPLRSFQPLDIQISSKPTVVIGKRAES